MSTLNKNSMFGFLRGMLDLVFGAGIALSCFLVVLFLYAYIFHHSIPHLYEPELSVSFQEPPLAATGVHDSTEYLFLGRWKTTLFAVEHSSLGFLALQLAWIALQPGINLGVLWHLRKIARSVEEGEPFNERAAGRLRAIGFLIVAGSLGRTSEDFLAGFYARSQYLLSKGRIELTFDYVALFWGVAVGLMVLVLAEIFRFGSAIHQEQELTV